jgi:tRNA G10  N-methylase Trm11
VLLITGKSKLHGRPRAEDGAGPDPRSKPMKEAIAGKYIYVINHTLDEEKLCQMEIKYLFNIVVKGKIFISDIWINPSRSPYIRCVLSVQYQAYSLDELVRVIESRKMALSNFKFVRIRIKDGEPGYDAWIESVARIGDVIEGNPGMENPEILLSVMSVDGSWYFGKYERNDNRWMEHKNKPHNSTYSLTSVISRVLVNIAVGRVGECSLVDPCCGVGTVIIEALSMAVQVRGYEINGNIAKQAKANLAYFGYEDVIEHADMHDIEEHYDVAIIDIPYGLITPYSIDKQMQLIKSARRISDRLVLVSITCMDEALLMVGFSIFDRCQVNKGYFKRYVTLCE